MISRLIKFFQGKRLYSNFDNPIKTNKISSPNKAINTNKILKVNKTVLLIDEEGKNLGLKELGDIAFDNTRYELNCVSTPTTTTDSAPDASTHAVYRLCPKGSAYRREKEAKIASVQSRRTSRTKQVHFGCTMSPHDYKVHIERTRVFLEEKGWRVQVVVEPVKNKEREKEMMRGRVRELCGMIAKDLDEVGGLEGAPSEHGAGMSFLLKPKKKFN